MATLPPLPVGSVGLGNRPVVTRTDAPAVKDTVAYPATRTSPGLAAQTIVRAPLGGSSEWRVDRTGADIMTG